MSFPFFIDTSVLNLSRLKYLCLLFTCCYALGFLAIATLKLSIEPYSVTKPELKDNLTKAILTTETLTSTLEVKSEVKAVAADVITQKNYENVNLMKMGSKETKEDLDFLLNIRKLIAYSVYLLNEPFKSTGCVKWWGNPLDLISYKVLSTTDKHAQQEIKFKVHPGIFKFRIILIQKFPPLGITEDEFEIVSPLEPLDRIPFADCKGADEFIDTVRATCLCSSATEMGDFQNKTADHRSEWNLLDQELVTWPLTASFSIPDYINFTNYKSFEISPDKNEVKENHYSKNFCGPEVKMLIMISSAAEYVNQRKVIRQTFANPEYLRGKGVKVVFLMGQPTTRIAKKSILMESNREEDIIVADFMDSYHNMTLGHLSMFKWAHLTCGQGNIEGISMPKHILKANHDVLLNVDLALQVAQSNPDVKFMGCLLCGKKVNRDFENSTETQYTPRYMHLANFHPGYLSGAAYLMSTDIIPQLLSMATTTPLIHLDDIYVTGILLRQLKIYPQHSELFTNGRVEPHSCWTKTMVSSSTWSPEDMVEQWRMLIEPIPSDCSLDNLPLKVKQLDRQTKRKCFFE